MGVIHTALSALSSYDLMLQVTANNLANLNTPGFKSQSLHFLDTFYQTLQAPTVPIGGGQGGKNPIQIGMGVAFGAIITRMAQGTFTPTGMSTDMTIIGNGFFAVTKNGQALYTRDGAFRVDANGNLVHAGTGALLLGWIADEVGNINTSSDLQPIKVPVGGALAARATTMVRFGGNLDTRLDVGSTQTPVSPSTTVKATLTLSASPSPKLHQTLGNGRRSSTALSSALERFSSATKVNGNRALGQLHSRSQTVLPRLKQSNLTSPLSTNWHQRPQRVQFFKTAFLWVFWRLCRLTLAVSSLAVSQTV